MNLFRKVGHPPFQLDPDLAQTPTDLLFLFGQVRFHHPRTAYQISAPWGINFLVDGFL
jgi:hypothetical protein